VADGVAPDHLALGRDLHRAGHDGHIDELASPAAPNPVAGVGERNGATPSTRRVTLMLAVGGRERATRTARCGRDAVSARRRSAWLATSTPAWRISTRPARTTTSTLSPAKIGPTRYFRPPSPIRPFWSTQRLTPGGRCDSTTSSDTSGILRSGTRAPRPWRNAQPVGDRRGTGAGASCCIPRPMRRGLPGALRLFCAPGRDRPGTPSASSCESARLCLWSSANRERSGCGGCRCWHRSGRKGLVLVPSRSEQ
jgi:hypothetical protein